MRNAVGKRERLSTDGCVGSEGVELEGEMCGWGRRDER